MNRTLTLSPDGLAPQQARAFVARQLAGELSEEHLATAQLLVSELVTNAVVHAASTVEVGCLLDGRGATVQVRDADTGPLGLRRSPEPELQEGGRGLLLVDELADAWGTEHRHGHKTVWFRVPTPATTPALAPGSAPAPGPVPAPALTPGPVPEPDGADVLRAAGRRLGMLVLPEAVQHALTIEQRLAEVLARVVDAVGGLGGQVCSASEQVLAQYGRPGLRVASYPLTAVGRRLGSLAVAPARSGEGVAEPSAEDDAFLRIAADRLALLVYEHGLRETDDTRSVELGFLSEATELLTAALSVRTSLTLLTQLVVPRLGDWAAVYRVDERGRAHRTAVNHRDEQLVDPLADALDADGDLQEAVRVVAAGGPVQRLAPPGADGRPGYVAVAPLSSRGGTLGVLLLGGDRPLQPMAFASLLELSRRAALAVDNSRLREEQASAASTLQAALLPAALPVMDGVELAARYHSASPGLVVGGDFYDALRLPDGSLVCAIGDVCGKGAEAAAVTGMSRDLIRLLLRDGHGLSGALQRLNLALLDDDRSSRFCTVALARLEAVGDGVLRAQVCLAGHPEPMVLRADGGTETVGVPGDLLGVIPGDLGVTEATVLLHPGDALVLYTDGITERRDGSRMFGPRGVRETLRTVAGADAATVAQRLEDAVRSFVDSDLRDDLAILVARCRPPA